MNQESLYEIVYASISSWSMQQKEITDLLMRARHFNAKNDVTGLLIYNEGEFVQILEGNEKTITTLYDRIKLDERHYNVRLLWDNPIEERDFKDWTMAFISAPDLEEINKEYRSEFLEQGVGYLHLTVSGKKNKDFFEVLRGSLLH